MKIKRYLCLLFTLTISITSFATGILPASSVVIVEEKSGDGSLVVTNTDNYPVLLTTELLNIDPKYKDLIVVTPQLIRVEPNSKQLIRFLLTTDASIDHEVLMRVIFEGIPPKNEGDNDKINLTVRQNIPLIIKPKSLPEMQSPWENLVWKYQGTELSVSNPTPYVVRLSSGIISTPGNIPWELPSNYILPNQTLILNTIGKIPPSITNVSIQPFTQWGYSTTKKYTAKVNNNAK